MADTPLYTRAVSAVARIRAYIGELIAGSGKAELEAELAAVKADRQRIVEAVETLAAETPEPAPVEQPAPTPVDAQPVPVPQTEQPAES